MRPAGADCGVLPDVGFATKKGTNPYEQTWRLPALTVTVLEASSFKTPSNQVLPRASALVSCRIVPDQEPDEVYEQLKTFLTADPPWGVRVTVKPAGLAKWWMTDPKGPAFEAALAALKTGFGHKPVAIGCGGSIPFVGPLAELFGGAPALLLGIEDPKTNAHSTNESLHADDFRKLTASLARLFENIGKLPDGRVKAEAAPTSPEPAPPAVVEVSPSVPLTPDPAPSPPEGGEGSKTETPSPVTAVATSEGGPGGADGAQQ